MGGMGMIGLGGMGMPGAGMLGQMGRARGPPGRPMPFAHHFGDPYGVQADMEAGQQELQNICDEYAFLDISSIKQWLCDYTIQEILENLTQCINRRDQSKFQIQMSILQTEWIKARKDPNAYDFYLEELETAFSENDNEMSKEFISEFEHPIHPQFAIQRINDAEKE